jgi:ATP-binding cassette, subfamily C, bacteriocin exporter
MNKQQLKHIRKTFFLQHDYADCGVACLLSLTRYYGGDSNIEQLRNVSGTSKTGTTLLGLLHAAQKTGFQAAGCQADWETMIAHPEPLILHVHINNYLQHYIVYYGQIMRGTQTMFVIGDPGKGILLMSAEELQEIWKSKYCLTLKPDKYFEKSADIHQKKRTWFKQLVKEDYPLLLISVFLGILIALLGATMMIFSQRLIDHILPDRDFKKLYLSAALVFLLLLMKEGAAVMRSHFLISQSKRFNLRIVDSFFRRLLRLPATFFDTRKIGEFSARLSDTSRIQKVISQLIGNTIIDGLVTLVTLSLLFIYSWQVPVICIITLPFYYLLIYRFNRPILSQQRNIMSNYAQAESNYISTFQGIDHIKNYDKHVLFAGRNRNVYETYQESVLVLGKTQIRLTFLANVFGVVFLMSILIFCSWGVLHGTMKAGILIAILGMCSSLLNSVANLALVTIPFNEAKIAFNRMFEYAGMDTENDAGIAIDQLAVIAVKHISFRFPGRTELLKDISLQVKKGEIIALMGENGCGKSTFGKILQKRYQVEKGEILVNDIPLDNISLSSWRKKIAVVEQQVHIFNGNVLENIAFEDADKHPQQVQAFIQRYNFAPFLESLPQSYMTLLGEAGVNLSGGQKQIIAFARALYHRPELLILDETNAALDRDSQQFLLNLLLQLKKEMAIIFITHRLHVLKSVCDKIYIMENGVIERSGCHETLLETENLYSLYWKDLGH